MHYQGIIAGRPFPVNRPLTEQDHKYRLRQELPAEGVDPYPELSVIKLNSTYLEIVDKYYGWKGWATLMLNALLLIPWGYFIFSVIFSVIKFNQGDMEGFYFCVITGFIMGVSGIVIWILGRFEWAYYTHYPIRLNRQAQMVHVFRKNGTVLSVPWSEVFFTLDQDARFWEIRGHVLEVDGETVKETFPLGTINALFGERGLNALHAHWEFFRRYMEEGPDAVAHYVKQALPIDGKRESFRVGYEVLAASFHGSSALETILRLINWPFNAASSVARWLAMRKSKIPYWPSEIEAVNVVAADDPYQIDARINPPELR